MLNIFTRNAKNMLVSPDCSVWSMIIIIIKFMIITTVNLLDDTLKTTAVTVSFLSSATRLTTYIIIIYGNHANANLQI